MIRRSKDHIDGLYMCQLSYPLILLASIWLNFGLIHEVIEAQQLKRKNLYAKPSTQIKRKHKFGQGRIMWMLQQMMDSVTLYSVSKESCLRHIYSFLSRDLIEISYLYMFKHKVRKCISWWNAHSKNNSSDNFISFGSIVIIRSLFKSMLGECLK